jgi:GDPmannose 4,6-dehydratase
MLQQEKPDDYIVATGKTYSLTNFISVVFEHLKLDWKDHVKSNKDFLRPTDIQSIGANPEKAEKVLGWKAQHCALDVARLMVVAELQKA